MRVVAASVFQVKLLLPWPNKALSPNYRSRSHWPRTNAIKSARRYAWGAAIGAGIPADIPKDGPVKLAFTFCPPDKRKRDEDNLIASCKSYQDGLADALRIDDNRFDTKYSMGEPITGGRVEVEIGA